MDAELEMGTRANPPRVLSGLRKARQRPGRS